MTFQKISEKVVKKCLPKPKRWGGGGEWVEERCVILKQARSDALLAWGGRFTLVWNIRPRFKLLRE